MARRRYTFDHIREDLLRRPDEDLLKLMGWTSHALPLTSGQRNWAAGYLAVQLVAHPKVNPPPVVHQGLESKNG